MIPPETSVVIVGGGPVGLVSSILLSLQGIDNVLFERQPDTSIHPKAVGLNQRTIEIFRKIGIEDDVLRTGAPPSKSGMTAWYTSLGPNGREICARHAWGAGDPYEQAYERASPCRYVLLPQIRLEPILKKQAVELNPGRIFFGHEVSKVDEQDSHVVVSFHERIKGESTTTPQTITAKYVLGADGGRFLVHQLGINMQGEPDIVDMVTAHIRAPISLHQPDPRIFIHWFISPELGGSIKTGFLYHLGPYPTNPETEEWVFACARLPFEQAHPFNKEDMLNRLHRTLKIPDLKVEVLSLSHWHVNSIVAERYLSRGGRIFFVGDAAKRIPPWGALGVNTGIQDADNITWKLAFALRHPDMDLERLLNSYDLERRPIGERVARTSLNNMRSHGLVLDKAIGLTPEKSEEENTKAMSQYFDPSDKDQGEAKRQEVQKALNILDIEFYAHAIEVGWFYDLDYIWDYDGAVSTKRHPQLKSDGEMDICEYRPSSLPGSQLPHAWLVDATKGRVSTREIVRRNKFVLLSRSRDWRKVSHPLIDVVIINDENAEVKDGEFQDADGTWKNICRDFTEDGALLVRPDSIIAFRWLDKEMFYQQDPSQEMSKIVARVLMVDD